MSPSMYVLEAARTSLTLRCSSTNLFTDVAKGLGGSEDGTGEEEKAPTHQKSC